MQTASVSEWTLIARTASIAVSLTALALWRADADLWGHLRFGLDILRDSAIASADPYSFTSDVPWINHEWLSEVMMALAYTAAGTAGLLLLKVGVAGTAYALIEYRLRELASPARWVFITVAVIATMPLVVTVRPQLWTVLAVTLLTGTMHWPIRRQWLLWVPLFALWANLHGGWIVGCGVIAASGVGTGLDRRDWRVVVPMAGVGVACLTATLLNPYGIGLWQFLWNTVGFERPDILEWQSVWTTANVAVTLIWGACAVTAAVVIARTPWSWSAVLPILLLMASSFRVIRLIGLFGIVVVMVGATRWRTAPAPRFPFALTVFGSALAAVPAFWLAAQEIRCLPVTDFDYRAAGALRSAQPGRLLLPFNWGQYAIWHFGPHLLVSMDGRRETVYSHETLEQRDVGREHRKILPFILEHQPEYLWLPRSSAENLREPLAGRYRRDVQTDRSVILVRADLPRLTPSELSPCFP